MGIFSRFSMKTPKIGKSVKQKKGCNDWIFHRRSKVVNLLWSFLHCSPEETNS